MGSSIEWGSAENCTTYVLGNMEEAGDHQTPRDENEDPDPAKIGLMFSAGGDGFCLTGTAAQLIETLGEAIAAVASYRPEEDGPAVPGTVPSVDQLVAILDRGERRMWLDPDDARDMAVDLRAALTQEPGQ